MCTLFIGIREVVQNILRPLALVGANRVLGFGLVAQGGRRQEPGRRLGSVDGSGLRDQVHPAHTPHSSTALRSSSWCNKSLMAQTVRWRITDYEHLDSHLYVVRGRSKGGN